MQNSQINIPLYKWLIGGSRIYGSYNTYSGSIGTSPSEGLFSSKIFNYNICIEKDEDSEIERVVARVFYGVKSLANTDEDEITAQSFLIQDENMDEVRAWLENQFSLMEN